MQLHSLTLVQFLVPDTTQQGGPQVNYQSVGSGSGVRQFNAGTTDFGRSDKLVKDGNERPVVQIPMTGGGYRSCYYNNPGCDLRVTQTELCRYLPWKHYHLGRGGL